MTCFFFDDFMWNPLKPIGEERKYTIKGAVTDVIGNKFEDGDKARASHKALNQGKTHYFNLHS